MKGAGARGSAAGREFSRYLDAIVDLTRQPDSRDLLAALLRTLSDSIQAQRARMFALSNPDHDAEFNENNIQHAMVNDLFDPEFGDPRPLNADPDLVACVCSRKCVSRETPGGRRLVFPILGKRHVRALLAIEELGEETLSSELLTKLLQVYSNQTLMLARSELDALTGLYNRQTFDDRMRRAAQSTARQRRAADGRAGAGLCFALFDIDHFKRVNDQYGHLFGDEVLTLLARLMVQSFRHEDMLFRYGGEEFAVVLANADLGIAAAALERFRCKVEAYAFPQVGHKTVSIGFTAFGAELGVEQVVMCADKALYYAKNNGRNQTRCYETLVAEKKLEPVVQPKGDIELF
jgi:diguanylate cyclase (GGDEF)-like protein